VSRIGSEEENLKIVHAVITLAHSLAMTVISEGVETAERLAYLRSLDSEFAQAFYFSRPVDADSAQIANGVWTQWVS
jgi:EAL domain-containing protein (putative c-di-GMP-specific phosphodiesterase class I)